MILDMVGKNARTEGQQKGHMEPGINGYEAFLRDMKNNWQHEQATIHETDTCFISTFKLRKGCTGNILEMHCPPSKMISMFGKNQTERKNDGCVQEINKEPYAIMVRCYGCDTELGLQVHINLKKISKRGSTSSVRRLSYGDLSSTGNRFQDSVYLSDSEVLAVEAVNPDIDIERIEASVEADVFHVLSE